MSKVITHEDENFGNSQEELQKFVQEQWKHSEKNVKWYEVFLPFSCRVKQDKCSDFGLTIGRTWPPPGKIFQRRNWGKSMARNTSQVLWRDCREVSRGFCLIPGPRWTFWRTMNLRFHEKCWKPNVKTSLCKAKATVPMRLARWLKLKKKKSFFRVAHSVQKIPQPFRGPFGGFSPCISYSSPFDFRAVVLSQSASSNHAPSWLPKVPSWSWLRKNALCLSQSAFNNFALYVINVDSVLTFGCLFNHAKFWSP